MTGPVSSNLDGNAAPMVSREEELLLAIFGAADLDPKPWVSWGIRYATRVAPSCYFEPGDKYSQNPLDYQLGSDK